MLNQCVRYSGQPCAVFGLFQQFERGKEFNAVGWRIAQRLEQMRRHQNRHIMRLAIQHASHLFRGQPGRRLTEEVASRSWRHVMEEIIQFKNGSPLKQTLCPDSLFR